VYASGVSADALFGAGVLGFLLLVRRRWWVWAGGVVAALSLTCVGGMLLMVPLVWALGEAFLAARRAGAPGQAALDALLPLGLAALGLVCFMVYLYGLTGDALAFVHVGAAWAGAGGVTVSQVGGAGAGLGFAGWYAWRGRGAEAWLLGVTVLLGWGGFAALAVPPLLANPLIWLGLYELLAGSVLAGAVPWLVLVCAMVDLVMMGGWGALV
jgi:hypothetical protein